MDWIKRNLYFLIGSLVALALMGLAGYYLYSKYNLNNEIMGKLNADYDELRRLNTQNPHPGSGKVNNIQAAKDQQQLVKDAIQKVRQHFAPIPRIPDVEKVTDRDFSAALSRMIVQLQREATNAGVSLPPNYSFSFEAQKPRVTFAAGSLEPLSVQMGEVKALCDILIQAKVNSLDNLRRERICADDQNGPVTDYLEKKSTTNALAIVTPYEVTFRAFSGELASVLAGLANSPHGFVVTAINEDPAPASATPEVAAPVYTALPQVMVPSATASDEAGAAASARARMMSRYGIGRGGRPVPRVEAEPQATQPVYAPTAPSAAAPPSKPTTVLNEKPLKVTLILNLVKLLPPKEATTGKEPAKPAVAARQTQETN